MNNTNIPELKKNGTLKARLLCSEVVTYTVGTDDVTVRQIIQEQPVITKNLGSGTQNIEFTASIEIPKNSPPSFAGKNNKILWEIEVNLELEGLVSTDKKMGAISMLPNGTLSTFAFCVDPEIVR
ncbi:MAG: hypothetical protein AAFO04_03030 [Cyanobacteria bacterium J06592_8]